jgi:predicted O-methyltransferase YrrM
MAHINVSRIRGTLTAARATILFAAPAIALLVVALLVVAPLAFAPFSVAARAQTPASAPTSIVPPDVSRLLGNIKAADKDLLAVSEEDGRFLRLTVASSRATHALEIGGANGYSAIWIGLGLRVTGGRLTSIEYDPARAKTEADNIRRAGLSDIVTVISGDAFQQIPKLPGTFDFVFLDAWKRDYRRFYDMVFPRLTPRGLFLAHNVVNKASEMGDFLSVIQDNPAVMTTIVKPGFEGMSVTYKLEGRK